ncbi:hypothetical protein M405DRAFT_358158 [Rhizopogon salebrosus TDB-379]|jgi:hypothetical protein|nr:hypothetical protein M405DRAFT_358158 [Rhizopogon salebrosus TDB-379]
MKHAVPFPESKSLHPLPSYVHSNVRASNETQRRGTFLFGCFHFHTFRASAVLDDAVSLHVCMQEPRDISIVDRQLVEDARKGRNDRSVLHILIYVSG